MSAFSDLKTPWKQRSWQFFGQGTIEYHRYRPGSLDTAGINLFHPTPIGEIREGYVRGIGRAVAQLTSAIEWFEETLGDSPETPEARAKRAFATLDLQPELTQSRVPKLFEDGHYANAVEDACKVLKLCVQMRSGSDLDGKTLMEHVFSPKNPTLRFSNLTTDSELNEQQGMMFLYSGTMLALRNPRAHELLDDDPDQALDYIAFINMLIKALGRTRS
jgi:uncharacterized protein (TIGR02391 family)